MTVIVELNGADLRRAFRKAPMITTLKINTWVRRTVSRLEREVKQQLSDNTDTGALQSSVHTVYGAMSAEMRPKAKHAIYVHEGRRPGAKMPPFGEGTSLSSWARRRGISPFVVARSIKQKGVKRDRYMDKAYAKVKPQALADGKKILDEIVREI